MKKSQEILEAHSLPIINQYQPVEVGDRTVKLSMAVDVGTSQTRAIRVVPSSNSVNENEITRIPNNYAVLEEYDVGDLKKMKTETQSFMNLMCVKMHNTTNPESPIHKKPVIISKGLISDRLNKTGNMRLTNTAKYQQVEEYVINTYTSIIATMYVNFIKYLSAGNTEKAFLSLNGFVDLAFMLPDGEKNNPQSESLRDKLSGIIEFELPLLGGIKGRIIIGAYDQQTLSMYGEAECAIYYYILANRSEYNMQAFKNHTVTIVDVGEGSTDIVFFKEREYLDRASVTSREVNGLALIHETVSNIERDLYNNPEKVKFTPTDKILRKPLWDNGDLEIVTPRGKYDMSEALSQAKETLSIDLANIVKTSIEQNSAIGGVDNVFLVILAGRTMSNNDNSPSLGSFLARRLDEQIGIPADICKITKPDSNLLGAGLKLIMETK